MLRSVVPEVMWVGRARALIAFAVTVALLMGVLVTAESARSDPMLFTVNSTGDSGDAALKWDV